MMVQYNRMKTIQAVLLRLDRLEREIASLRNDLDLYGKRVRAFVLTHEEEATYD